MTTIPTFPDEHFLLQGQAAEKLYHEYAADMPIMDYHNHLPPADVADNRQFENLTEVWLDGDHYKWRAMRTAGVDERFITGDASDEEKFTAWARTVPRTIGNPLYHWTHLELHNPLGIRDRLLNPDTAAAIWNDGNRRLQEPACSVHGLLKNWKVKLICTTDDPVDDLQHHEAYSKEKTDCRMIPAFRPDRVFAFDQPAQWNAWIDQLSIAANTDVHDLSTLLAALEKRVAYFHDRGCRLSDHGLGFIPDAFCPVEETDKHIKTIRSGGTLRPEVIPGVIAFLLTELGRLYHARNWTQQFHVGVLRNVNTRQLNAIGKDAGFDMIGDFSHARGMARHFDRLEQDEVLPRTIIYNLNPADNEVMASLIGCFQDGQTEGKIQLGSSWWFLDQKDGIEKQLTALSNLGLLSCFVGMLTDSRSFLSFSRHEYFRRVLCSFLGQQISSGLLPADYGLIGGVVQDICYRNAERYFDF